MNMKDNNNLSNDEEISLLELFSVLVKYRFLICFGTLIAVLLSFIFFFVTPKFKKSANVGMLTVQYSYTINALPDAFETAFNRNATKKNPNSTVAALAQYKLTDLGFLAEEIKAYNPFGASEASLKSNKYNNTIRKAVEQNKYLVELAPLETEIKIKIQIPENRLNDTTSMVEDMISKTNKFIEDYALPKIESLEMTVPEVLSSIQAGDNSLIALQMIEENQNLIKHFRQNYKSFLEKGNEPFIIPGESSKKKNIKKIIIFDLAALFFFVFIAFILNAIASVKQDPEECEKIRKAWESGKIIKK